MILFYYRLKWLAESGLVDYWAKRNKPKNEECNSDSLKTFSKANDRKILSLHDLCGPFIFLITGSILSLFVFLLEKLYYHFYQGIVLKSSPPIETTEINHSLKDIDHRIVVMDEPLVDIENQESCFDATIKDKVENLATTSATDLKVEEGEFETETVEQDMVILK